MEHLLTLLRNNITFTGVLLIVCVSICLLSFDWNTIRRRARNTPALTSEEF